MPPFMLNQSVGKRGKLTSKRCSEEGRAIWKRFPESPSYTAKPQTLEQKGKPLQAGRNGESLLTKQAGLHRLQKNQGQQQP